MLLGADVGVAGVLAGVLAGVGLMRIEESDKKVE